MDTNQQLRLLALGLDSVIWQNLTRQITKVFSENEINLEFDHLSFKWSKFKDVSLEKLKTFEPDYIFTSVEFYKNFKELEATFQLHQLSHLIDEPSLILIEKEPLRFIKQYCESHPFPEIQFRQYPKLRIEDADLFIEGLENSTIMEIQPLPELFFKKMKDIFLEKDKLVGFASWQDLSELGWKENKYSPKEFIELFKQTYQSDRRLDKSKGILFDCGRAFFFSGFLIEDITRIETDFFPIEHLISYQQVKTRGVKFESLLFKMLETAKFRCSLKFNETYFENVETIKAQVPIIISSDNRIISKIFQQLMIEDEYLRTSTLEATSDAVNRFLISINTESVEDTPFTYSFILDKEKNWIETIENIEGFKPLSTNELEDLSDPVLINRSRSHIEKRLKKLGDQMKVLASSKAETDKKRYMDLISRNKMETIINLLEIAEIWDENTCDVSVARQEDVLILYDDSSQVEQIDLQLENNNRKTYLDITKQIVNLESLVNFNVGPLEQYLHDGVIICCLTTKAVLMRRFQQFEKEIADKKYPPLNEAIENLKAEQEKCLNKLSRAKILEFAAELKQLYLERADELYSAILNYSKSAEKTKYDLQHRKNVCVIGDDEQECGRIQKAVESFAGSTELNFKVIHHELDFLGISGIDEGPAESGLGNHGIEGFTNSYATQLSGFYRNVANSIGLKDIDIFFITGHPQIYQILVEFLRQEGSKYINTPIVMLAAGDFNYKIMLDLSLNAVKVLYQDQIRRSSSEALSKTFKHLLTAV